LPLGLDPLVIPRGDHCQCVQLRRHDPEFALRKAGFDERRRNGQDETTRMTKKTEMHDDCRKSETTTRHGTLKAADYQWH
jgi:hypothetical protein